MISMIGNDDLAAQFAREAAKRKAQPQPDNEPPPSENGPPSEFSGIREIVLDESGNAKSIPRRPPPPPGMTQQDSVNDLLQSPSFLFGVLISVASAGIFIAIAGADAAASA